MCPFSIVLTCRQTPARHAKREHRQVSSERLSTRADEAAPERQPARRVPSDRPVTCHPCASTVTVNTSDPTRSPLIRSGR